MSGQSFEVPPLSRVQIRKMARKIRALSNELLGSQCVCFDVVKFLDVGLVRVIPEFKLEILTTAELGRAHGMTYPDHHTIQVREDVYEAAYNGQGRDRLTLAHELGHYVLHAGIGLARTPADENVKPYRQSEWQANAFGGELLVSADYVGQCASLFEVASRFGVTNDAAKVQWNVFKKEGIVK
ncbi:MAG: ImmA/IrrE family metallo-endopeptidase [Candidatus Thiodiazotropha sp. (ex Codakia rugifera)]|nr:ImmA/IrrE family metallo-endopeptidase [Candidatus Thiodiazotropha sp. (ex Codakia rugifera)]